MDDNRLRLSIFIGIIVMMLSLLAGRLAWLQLVESEIYSGESRKNSVHSREIDPARGLIYDRNGSLLVDNIPTYSITLTPRFFDDEKTHLLATLLSVTDSVVLARLKKASDWSPYKPSRAFQEVSLKDFSRVEENIYRLPGVGYILDQKRRYHYHHAGHLLGYINEVSRRQLQSLKNQGYRPGDPIGQTGIEKAYESELRGNQGEEFYLVNVHGQEVGTYSDGEADNSPDSGANLFLTIDSSLQALTERLFVNKRGGAVAIDPKTGEILAMVSAPNYDPAIFAGKVDREIWEELRTDPNKPLFNRSTLSGQPPGSTFKPFLALISLQEGLITENTLINCPGYYQYGRRRFGCHGGAHGNINVKDALKYSCNTFFHTLMMMNDFQKWHDWGIKFGFGSKSGLDFAEQTSGIFPDSSYYDKSYGINKWTRGYLVSLGTGQGDIIISPMQLARYAAAVANEGQLYTPRIVRMLQDEDGNMTRPQINPPVDLGIDPQHFATVREGMRRMAMENSSTVRWGDVVVAGKTGTAENPHGKDHAWFIGFAPFDDPEIAVAVFVENAGFGGEISAPIAGQMMEQYLTGKLGQHPNWIYESIMKHASEGMEGLQAINLQDAIPVENVTPTPNPVFIPPLTPMPIQPLIQPDLNRENE